MSLGSNSRFADPRWTARQLRIKTEGKDVCIVGPCGLNRILSPDEARKVALALREAADEADRRWVIEQRIEPERLNRSLSGINA